MTFVEYSSLALTSIFVILDPIAVVPAFIAMTPNDSAAAKPRMARLACLLHTRSPLACIHNASLDGRHCSSARYCSRK